MKLHLSDTNIFIYAYNEEEPYASNLSIWITQKTLLVSAIVVAEFLSGAIKEEKKRFETILDKYESIPVDTTIASIAAHYRKSFIKKGKKLRLSDCLIAATAKVCNAALVTLNLNHFPMKDINKIPL